MTMDGVTADVIGNLALVLGASSLRGALARRIGQPTAVGRIAADIIFKRSLRGRFPGDSTAHLPPDEAMPLRPGIAPGAQRLADLDGRRTDRRSLPLLFGVVASSEIPVAPVLAADRGMGHRAPWSAPDLRCLGRRAPRVRSRRDGRRGRRDGAVGRFRRPAAGHGRRAGEHPRSHHDRPRAGDGAGAGRPGTGPHSAELFPTSHPHGPRVRRVSIHACPCAAEGER
jgi:hypothetical protein